MDVIFKGRHTEVLERFRKHAIAKLVKVERLDARAIRVDVEVSAEHNPRQAGRKERVELTITSGGPTIRAEAAAEDRFAALDMALAKLESRLRRASDRRKGRHGGHAAIRLTDLAGTASLAADGAQPAAGTAAVPGARQAGPAGDRVVAIERDGDGPLVVREKFHGASPMTIGQALLEMELIGHDFFLFRDVQGGVPSVVYRRRGYSYGVIRLVERPAEVVAGNGAAAGPGVDATAAAGAGTAASAAAQASPRARTGGQRNGRANGRARRPARLGTT